MSNTPEPELDLELHFLPSWAKQSPDINRYANYEGREDRSRRGDRWEGGPRPAGRPGMGGPDRGGGARGRFGGPGGGRPGGRPVRREPPRAPEAPLPEVSVTFTPDERGVESLARQIKFTGRAYPVFEIAHLILRKPDRYQVTLGVVKGADGQPVQTLWLCGIDDSLWLSQDEAVQHVMRKHFDLFYKTERIATDPPKGTYTFVAQCGLSGTILGPPNFHDYQTKLHKLHAARFSRLPFEAYKAKIRIVRDEETVKKWVEEQSWKTEFECLNLPEPLRLPTREEVEKHFREVHVANVIRQVESWSASGAIAQQGPSPILRQILRRAWEDQERFPLRVVTILSQQFAAHGLQFFKVNKTITHVSVARPHFLDLEASPVSDGIRRIVEFIHGHAGCTRRQLIAAIAPTPLAPASVPVAAPAVTPPAPAPAESAAATDTPASAAPTAAVTPPAEPQPTPEQTAIIADLHWLIHQGHVIEFANGRLETAKRPIPKPPPRVTPKAAAPAAEPAMAVPAAEGSPTEGTVGPSMSPEAAAHEEATPNQPVPVEPVPPVEVSGETPERLAEETREDSAGGDATDSMRSPPGDPTALATSGETAP